MGGAVAIVACAVKTSLSKLAHSLRPERATSAGARDKFPLVHSPTIPSSPFVTEGREEMNEDGRKQLEYRRGEPQPLPLWAQKKAGKA